MQPRQMRETFIPVHPNRAYSMVFSFQMFSFTTDMFKLGRSFCSRYKIYTPLNNVNKAPARVHNVGTSRQMTKPHITLNSNGVYSNGATTEACRSEEHTAELQSPCKLVCRLLLEK